MAKKALLVGVNDYAPAGPGGPDLHGCVNDVRDMAHTLFALEHILPVPAQMRILTNQNATRANIMKGLKWLVTGAKSRDLLVFHYSGHGSQVADISGDDLDGWDETICPHDFSTAGMIKDDDLRTAFSGIAEGVNFEVILDSCHSGTGTRDQLFVRGNPENTEVTIRYVEPPLDYGYFLDVTPDLTARRILRQTVVVPGLNHVLWAGCRDNQTSAEAPIGGVVRGIFTYCFCQVLRRAGIGITRRRLDQLVSADIRRMGYSQVPQLEGTKPALNEKVFT